MEEETTVPAQTQSAQLKKLEKINSESEILKNILDNFATRVQNCLEKADQVDFTSEIRTFLGSWSSISTCIILALYKSHSDYDKKVQSELSRLIDGASEEHGRRREVTSELKKSIEMKIAARLDEMNNMNKHITEELTKIQNEKQMHVDLLNKWVEEERKRIENHAESQRNFLENIMQKRIIDLEAQRNITENKISKDIAYFKNLLKVNEEMNEKSGLDLERVKNQLELCISDLNILHKKYETHSTGLSYQLENLSEITITVGDKVKTKLLMVLQQTQLNIQAATTALLEDNKHYITNLIKDFKGLNERTEQNSQTSMESIDQTVHKNSKSSIQELCAISSMTATSMSQSYSHNLNDMLNTIQQKIEHIGLKKEVSRLEVLEIVEPNCLNYEYGVNCASGNTPSDSEPCNDTEITNIAESSDTMPEDSKIRTNIAESSGTTSEDSAMFETPSFEYDPETDTFPMLPSLFFY